MGGPRVRAEWEPDELIEAWTLVKSDWDLIANKAGVTRHEHKRLGRGIELAALAEQLRADGIGLEFLTGELQGSHNPSGVVFTVLAALFGDGARVHPRPHP